MPRSDNTWIIQIGIGLAVLVLMQLFSRWWKTRSGTILMNAVLRGDSREVKALLAKRAFVNAKDGYSGRTPLIMATVNGHTEIVRALLSRGADANMKDADGWTALMFAQEYRHAKIEKLLREAGAEE